MGLHPVEDHDRDGRRDVVFRRAEGMGLDVDAALDRDSLRGRVDRIEERLHRAVVELLTSQNVRIIEGAARLKGPNQVVVETATGVEELEADAIQLSTGSRPCVPSGACPTAIAF